MQIVPLDFFMQNTKCNKKSSDDCKVSVFLLLKNAALQAIFSNAACRDCQRSTLSLSTQHAAFEKFPAEFHPPK